MDSKQKAIFKTLLYSSLFRFPLSSEELYRYLFFTKTLTFSDFSKSLEKVSSKFCTQDGLYSLPEYKEDIVKRQKMQSLVAEKYKKALGSANLLSYIPTIYFIGLSGSLSVGSAKKEDDIDFFIITRKNTIFISRLFALFLLQISGRRRGFKEKKSPDKICLNMWIDMSSLQFSPHLRDLYTAREIAQMQPLFERQNVYQKFIQTNDWVRYFLPHAFLKPFPVPLIKKRIFLSERFFSFWEPVARKAQLFIINRHLTTEKVGKNFLAFHPFDYRKKVILRFEKILQQKAKIL